MTSQVESPNPQGVRVECRRKLVSSLAYGVVALIACQSCSEPPAPTLKKADPHSRLQQVSAALSLYVTDFDESFPPFIEASRVRAALTPYVADDSIHYAILEGESDKEPPDPVKHWEWNPRVAGVNRSRLAAPAKVLTFFDSDPRSMKRLVATADGRVRAVLRDEWFDLEDQMSKTLSAASGTTSPSKSDGNIASEARWPPAWRHASTAFGLYGLRASELEVLGEPTDVHEVKKGAWWVEEHYAGWLEEHNVFRWVQQGLELNPKQRNSEPRASLVVGVQNKSKLITLVKFAVPSATGSHARDWNLTISEAAQLLGIRSEPIATYYNQAPLGGFHLLSVFRKADSYVAMRSFTNELFDHSSQSEFETGKINRTSRLKDEVTLDTLRVGMLYLGPRRTKFSFNAVNQPKADDLESLPFKRIHIPIVKKR